MPPQTPNKLMQVLPYLFSLLTFLSGFYISYLSYSFKVDALVTQISGLTNSINTLSSKQESANALYNNLDKRVSILEMKAEVKPATVNIDNDQTHK
ncbi:hypothetical protein DYU05_03900 [Mucilaginibacter terrenus]|uniref:Uncharacterized protein n=1 Tax=Mucilaginibacter terrenus TaxID=2482727 RepID=A0A3E2NUS8_9SPHI|nr:hypothetical protein [Mucilaginibacter terrenus]RFZ84758.1 hypothetical protein DYU05_03900 [Mucilaginibacter terrenus]